jgi:hypothetical protein
MMNLDNDRDMHFKAMDLGMKAGFSRAGKRNNPFAHSDPEWFVWRRWYDSGLGSAMDKEKWERRQQWLKRLDAALSWVRQAFSRLRP